MSAELHFFAPCLCGKAVDVTAALFTVAQQLDKDFYNHMHERDQPRPDEASFLCACRLMVVVRRVADDHYELIGVHSLADCTIQAYPYGTVKLPTDIMKVPDATRNVQWCLETRRRQAGTRRQVHALFKRARRH